MNFTELSKINKAKLLISVTSIEEAQIALENGADIIDLKEPSAGALGALPMDRIQSIVEFVKSTNNVGAKLTSATIGDLPMKPELLLSQITKLTLTGVDFIKIGFFETDDYQECLDALRPLVQSGTNLIAVFFAETTYPQYLVSAIKNAGFLGIMLDTAKKKWVDFTRLLFRRKKDGVCKKRSKTRDAFRVGGFIKARTFRFN